MAVGQNLRYRLLLGCYWGTGVLTRGQMILIHVGFENSAFRIGREEISLALFQGNG